jgi:uncharacterized repeat protein (TIGR03833 family)
MNSSRQGNRPNRGQSGRGRGGRNQHDRQGLVPTTQHVVIGASVSIVLKIDQPTGRQVQGFVGELLTRGNHPRGIKVRLRDGRVGRVQRMATEEEADKGSAGLTGLSRNGEIDSAQNGNGGSLSSFTPGFLGERHETPIDEPPREELSLADYIVPKNKGKNQQKKISPGGHSGVGNSRFPSQETSSGSGIENTQTSPTSVCPVCGDFEGDETAVAHHVNSHFD